MSFIRRKRVHKHLKGGGKQSYFYYYRVESVRVEGKVKQIVKDYLGTAETAIDRLEATKIGRAEKKRLLSQLRQLVSEELGTTSSRPPLANGTRVTLSIPVQATIVDYFPQTKEYRVRFNGGKEQVFSRQQVEDMIQE